MYTLIVRPKAEKHFSRLPKNLQQKVAEKLKKLQGNPFQSGLNIKKLVNTEKSYRLRIRELRIIYQMDTEIKEIAVLDIDFRRTGTYG